jgi:hypothetical protein
MNFDVHTVPEPPNVNSYANNSELPLWKQDSTPFINPSVHKPTRRTQTCEQSRQSRPIQGMVSEPNGSTWQSEQETALVITTQPVASDAKGHAHRCLEGVKTTIVNAANAHCFGEPKIDCGDGPVSFGFELSAMLVGGPVGLAVGGIVMGPQIAAACPTLGPGAVVLGVAGGMALPCAVGITGIYLRGGDFVRPCLGVQAPYILHALGACGIGVEQTI